METVDCFANLNIFLPAADWVIYHFAEQWARIGMSNNVILEFLWQEGQGFCLVAGEMS